MKSLCESITQHYSEMLDFLVPVKDVYGINRLSFKMAMQKLKATQRLNW